MIVRCLFRVYGCMCAYCFFPCRISRRYGFAGLVEGLVARLTQEMQEEPLVVATGGLASLVAPYVFSIQEVVPDLVLEGLFHLYQARMEDA